MKRRSEKKQKCYACGRELGGDAASGIEEEIQMLLTGSDDKSLLDRAWYMTAENKRNKRARCLKCIIEKKGMKNDG